MTDFVVPPPEQMAVPVAGVNGFFPVRRIYCVGRNYTAHIREMGGDERDPPFFFQKPTDAIVSSGSIVPYPTLTGDFQFEIELVLAIGIGGSAIVREQAANHVFGTAVGIDLTRRDVQVNARNTGRPWEIGKSFDHSAPISTIVPLSGAALPTQGAISLSVNGEDKQVADLADLIWDCSEIVAVLSTHYRLEPGDLIYTGTPSGVGPVLPGDQLVGRIAGLPDLIISIGN